MGAITEKMTRLLESLDGDRRRAAEKLVSKYSAKTPSHHLARRYLHAVSRGNSTEADHVAKTMNRADRDKLMAALDAATGKY